MSIEIEKKLQSAASGYADNLALRATVQAIPYIGGPVDTIFAGKGAKIQAERIEDLLEQLRLRMENVEAAPKVNDEELYDILMLALNKAAVERVKSKRAMYANIVAKQVSRRESLEDAESAIRIVSDLNEMHLRIHSAALHAPQCGKPFNGLQVISLADSAELSEVFGRPLWLAGSVPYAPIMLRHACSDLVAKGLLHDEGLGRLDIKAMEYLVPTDTARWLDHWLRTENA